MNARIKELDKAAQEYAGRIAGNDEDSNYVAWFNIYKEKFAELIVKECAQLARDTDLEDVEGGDSEVLRAAKRQILEHFGVEE